jgi:3'(2'), 5'-bisphosphate nucleotidase
MLEASIAAAAVILEVYGRPIVEAHKSDGSPVTEADQAAEAVILTHLAATGIPVLAEESVAAASSPSTLRWSRMAGRCWAWCWRR